MDIKLTSQEGLSRNFKVVVPASDIKTKKETYIKNQAGRVKVDGFRPGKAPMSVLEQRLGGDALNHALRNSIDAAIKSAVKDHNLRYIGEPKVEFDEFNEGSDLSFSLGFEIMPDVEVKDFSKLELENLVVDLSDKEVDESIKDLHKKHKSFQPSEGKAKKGSRVSVEITLSQDGKNLSKYNKVNATVDLDSKSFMLSGFDTELAGTKAGDEKTFESTVAENFADKELAGKKVQAHVVVKQVLEPKEHKIDDAFAKEFGHDSLDVLKNKMRENLEKNYASIARLYMKRHLLDALDKMYDFDLPKSMVEGEFNNIWQHLQNEIAQAKANGEYDEKDAKPEAELKAEYEAIAKRRVKLGLVISEVARVEKINLSQEELRNAIYREAMRYPGQERQVMDYFRSHPQAIDRIAAPILEDKVVDQIATKVKTKEIKVDVPSLKKKVRGVVPTLFDEEEENNAA